MMPEYERVLVVLIASGIICILIALFYFTLKKKGKWESFIDHLVSVIDHSRFVFDFCSPLFHSASDEDFLKGQERRELRSKILRERKDFCP
jgi:hypothetical protein